MSVMEYTVGCRRGRRNRSFDRRSVLQATKRAVMPCAAALAAAQANAAGHTLGAHTKCFSLLLGKKRQENSTRARYLLNRRCEARARRV